MSSFFSTGGTSPASSSEANGGTAAAAAAAAADSSPHYHFIHSMILPSTVKIQKELRGRKFRVRNSPMRKEEKHTQTHTAGPCLFSPFFLLFPVPFGRFSSVSHHFVFLLV
jgi:hypothetical protein